jgi:hypothetical protein
MYILHVYFLQELAAGASQRKVVVGRVLACTDKKRKIFSRSASGSSSNIVSPVMFGLHICSQPSILVHRRGCRFVSEPKIMIWIQCHGSIFVSHGIHSFSRVPWLDEVKFKTQAALHTATILRARNTLSLTTANLVL